MIEVVSAMHTGRARAPPSVINRIQLEQEVSWTPAAGTPCHPHLTK